MITYVYISLSKFLSLVIHLTLNNRLLEKFKKKFNDNKHTKKIHNL